MTQSYFDSAEGLTMSYLRALEEVRKHEAPEEDFIAEFGVRSEYEAQEVLSWLGY